MRQHSMDLTSVEGRNVIVKTLLAKTVQDSHTSSPTSGSSSFAAQRLGAEGGVPSFSMLFSASSFRATLSINIFTDS